MAATATFVVALLLAGLLAVAEVKAVYEPELEAGHNEDAVLDATATAPEGVEIVSLGDHCEDSVCRSFHFGSRDQVATFNLPTEVRISEQSTYDLATPNGDRTLTFVNSSFAHFPLHLFHSFLIMELDMRDCGVEEMSWKNFLLASDLKVLLLSHNRLRRIDELTFNFASELQYLFLDSNRVERLVSESFKGLSKLKMLNLQNNRLRALPRGLFEPLPDLQELNLAQNQLRVLDDDTFVGCRNLFTLRLEENRLRQIGEYTFQAQRRLLQLDLSQNPGLESLVNNLSVRVLNAANCSLQRINLYGSVRDVNLRDNRIQELYFSEPESLETLNLRRNHLVQIASLSRATHLRSLDLGDNPGLGNVPDPWYLPSLERLDLSNTSLRELPFDFLSTSSRLQFLNVSHNRLRQIEPGTFQRLEHLEHFYIHANDWNCFNLKLLMDLVIRPHKMYLRPDRFDPSFPGDYINGIACMYRLVDGGDAAGEVLSENYMLVPTMAATSTSQDGAAEALVEMRKLRKELVAIVGFYEQKFSRAFDMINELKTRLDEVQRWNNTVWDHVTITT